MSSTISIRPATLDDINTIGFLAQQIWPATYGAILSADQLAYMMNIFYNPASIREQMLEKKHSFFLLEEDDEPAGFVSYSKLPGDENIFRIEKIYVLTDRQGKGLGKTMIEFIVEETTLEGAKALQLNVNRFNKAKQFYERLGFHVIREEDIDIGNGYFMNDYVMQKTLQ